MNFTQRFIEQQALKAMEKPFPEQTKTTKKLFRPYQTTR
jgi:hypothetical protein